MAFDKIRLIARYERNLIIRNRLFWVFACCVSVGIVFSHWFGQGRVLGGFTWLNRALPSFIPFWNAWLYNLLQVIIVIFIGIDFVWRDRHIETNAAFSARPVSNLTYQVGKVLGIIEICLVLNLVIIGAGMVFHLLFGELGTFQLKIYFIYLLIMTLPTLFFVLGIALIVANQVKNHALVILLLLGLFVLFYFGATNLVWGAIDPWGRTLPLLFSDVTGMACPDRVILQRGAFIFMGLGFIALAMGMTKRLSDQINIIWKVRIGGVACIVVGILLGSIYYSKFCEINNRRDIYRNIFGKYSEVKGGHVKSHTIYFCQEGNKVMGMSELVLTNESSQPLIHPLLYLNPGLEVTVLTEEQEGNLPYVREEQVILLERTLQPGEEIVLHVEYEGRIEEAICFLEFTDEEFHDTRLASFFRTNHLMFRHGGNVVRVGDDYTLLFPECLWYPVCVPPVNVDKPLARQYDFTHYLLKVGKIGKRVAISQGEMETKKDTIIFKNKELLPSISLSIGPYERRSIELDSLTLELYHFPGHDFFIRDYTSLEDSAEFLLRDPVSAMREIKGGDYPFRKFTLIETPVNFVPRQWKGFTGSEFVQPELLFYPENMYLGYYSHVEFWPGDEDERTRFELEVDALCNLLDVNLLTGVFDCSAMFGEFSGILQSSEYPGFGGIINDLSLGDFSQGPTIYLGDELEYSEVVTYWTGKSIRDALLDKETKGNRLQGLLEKKYDLIKKHLQALVGERELFEFVKQFKKRYLFMGPDFEVFEQEFNTHFNLNLRDILDYYYEEKELPALFIRDLKVELYEEDEEAQNIGSCKIYNPTSVPAVVTLSVATYSMGEHELGSGKRSYLIPEHSCKEIRVNLGIRDIFTVEMNLSQNIPGENFLELVSKGVTKTKDGRTGIWDTDSTIFTLKEPGIIVDDREAGFVIHEKKRREKLAAYFSKKENEDKYSYVYDHEHWTLVANARCYGDIVKSGHYKIAGNGKSKVEWRVHVEKSGRYEVWAYVPDVEATAARKVFIQGARLFYQVESKNGVIDVEVLLDDEEPGWISLGQYDFDRGEYNVFLSDRGGDSLTWENDGTYMWEDEPVQLIFADAIKWVPVNK